MGSHRRCSVAGPAPHRPVFVNRSNRPPPDSTPSRHRQRTAPRGAAGPHLPPSVDAPARWSVSSSASIGRGKPPQRARRASNHALPRPSTALAAQRAANKPRWINPNRPPRPRKPSRPRWVRTPPAATSSSRRSPSPRTSSTSPAARSPASGRLMQARPSVFTTQKAHDTFLRHVENLASSGEEGRRRGLGMWMLGRYAEAAEALAPMVTTTSRPTPPRAHSCRSRDSKRRPRSSAS